MSRLPGRICWWIVMWLPHGWVADPIRAKALFRAYDYEEDNDG